MNRRSFFGTFLGALLCKFLPKPKINPTRVDTLDLSRWGAQFGFPLEEPALIKDRIVQHRIYGLAFVTPKPEVIPTPSFFWEPNSEQAEVIRKKESQGVDVQAAIDAL